MLPPYSNLISHFIVQFYKLISKIQSHHGSANYKHEVTIQIDSRKIAKIRNPPIFVVYSDHISRFTADGNSISNFAADWWNQKNGASDKWFGLEAPMKTYGFSVKGDMKEAYFGQVAGGLPKQPKNNWCFDMKLKGTLELDKLFPALNG